MTQEFEYGYSSSISLKTDYHYHNNYEVYFLISGKNECFINSKTYHLSKNDMVFINKGILHKSNYSSRYYSRAVINFSDEYLSANMLALMRPLFEQTAYTPENPDFIKKLFLAIRAERDKNDALSDELIKCYFTELICYCIRNKTQNYQNSGSNPSIERLVSYMNHNYNLSITLGEAAGMLHMSQGHLSRLFLKSTGFGFKEYLQIVRIKNAKNLLSGSNKPVRQIACECGFNDSNYFSKSFKDAVGVSPLQYRKSK